MADKKISALTEKTTPVADDLLPIVDSASTPIETKKIKWSNITSVTLSIVKSDTDVADAIAKKHSNALDHSQNTDSDLDPTFEATFEKIANKGVASGYASLDSSQKVVQDPANATATPTASKIPIADGSGKLDSWTTIYTQGARVYHNADQTLSSNTWTTLAFNNERFDTDSIHDNVTNNSRLTCKTDGKYLITAHFIFAAASVGSRGGVILLNGAKIIAYNQVYNCGTDPTGLSFSTIYDMAVNDYVELQAFQNSGGNLAVQTYTSGDNDFSPIFMMQRIG